MNQAYPSTSLRVAGLRPFDFAQARLLTIPTVLQKIQHCKTSACRSPRNYGIEYYLSGK